jgi:hypothetical protein
VRKVNLNNLNKAQLLKIKQSPMKSPPHPGYAYSKTLISVIFELSGRNANEDEAEIQIHISP